MPSRKEIDKMSHREKIEKELKSASKYGISPKRNVILDPNFRVEGSTPIQFSAGSTFPPTMEEAKENDNDFGVITTDYSAIPDQIEPLIFKDSPKALQYSIEKNLDKLNNNTREKLLPIIVTQLRDLQIQSSDDKKFTKIQQRISKAIFGIDEFEDIQGEAGGAFQSSK